ncbi:unnamed protein product [Closterium sp. NIES-53]
MAKSAQGKELLELYDKLQTAAGKAADSPADEDRALDLLAQMADCHVSTEILMETQMGKLIRKLTKHTCAGIQKGAGKLVEQWKQVVAAEARGGGGGKEKDQERGRKEGEREGKRSGESERGSDGGKEGGKPGRGGDDSREDVKSVGNGGSGANGANGASGGKERDGAKGNAAEKAKGAGGAAAVPFKTKMLIKTGDVMRDRPREAVLQALCLVAGEVQGEEEERARAVDVTSVAMEVETELWRKYGATKDLKQRGQLRLAYVASQANTADIFTKALPPGDHQRFCTMLACFALLDWSCDLLFPPTLPMGEHRLEHRTKHIALRYFLARELQQRGQLRLTYVATRANIADIFTKALPPGDHQRFCTLLGLVPTLPHLL